MARDKACKTKSSLEHYIDDLVFYVSMNDYQITLVRVCAGVIGLLSIFLILTIASFLFIFLNLIIISR